MIVYSDLLLPWLGHLGDVDDRLPLVLEVTRVPPDRDLKVTPAVDVGVEGDEHHPAGERDLAPSRGRTAVRAPPPYALEPDGEAPAGEEGVGALDGFGCPKGDLDLREVGRGRRVDVEDAPRARERVVPMLASMLVNPRDVVADLWGCLLDAEVVAGDNEALGLDFILGESPVGDEVLADLIVD